MSEQEPRSKLDALYLKYRSLVGALFTAVEIVRLRRRSGESEPGE